MRGVRGGEDMRAVTWGISQIYECLGVEEEYYRQREQQRQKSSCKKELVSPRTRKEVRVGEVPGTMKSVCRMKGERQARARSQAAFCARMRGLDFIQRPVRSQ